MSEGEQVAAQRTQQPKQGEHNEERSFEPRPKNTTKLQIKALPYGTTKDDLTDLCRRYGQITAIEAKGTQGFVTFFKPDEAQLAIHKLDGTAYRGYTLRVAYAKEPFVKKPEGQQPQQPQQPQQQQATTTTTSTTTTAGAKTNEPAKPAEPVNKPRFAQQQKIVQKPKPTTSFNRPQEQPKAEEPQPQQQPQQQQQQQQQRGKGKQGKGKQQGKGAQKEPVPVKEVRTYRVTVEKTVVTTGETTTTKQEEGFTFSVSHQQYLDYIIPLLKDIQAQKEKERQKEQAESK